MTDRPRPPAVPAGLAIVLALALAACGSAAIPSSPPSPATSPGLPAPTEVPGGGGSGGGSGGVPDPSGATDPDPGAGGGGGTGGGGIGGNPGTILDPGQIGSIFNPAPGPDGEPTMVKPVPNARGVHDVNATLVEAVVDGRAVAVRVSWWSGVEPCSVFVGIDVTRGEGRITLTVTEGSAAAPDTFCTEQAVYKAAVMSLGELDPGTWTIVATGEAPPITIEVGG